MPSSNTRAYILRLAHHYVDANDILKSVRIAHLDASKKDINLAVFEIMIQAAASDQGFIYELHRLGMCNRAEE